MSFSTTPSPAVLLMRRSRGTFSSEALQAAERVRVRLAEPWDGAGLAVYRFLFGLMMAGGLLRFLAKGWVERVYVEPSFFFKFPGFEWTVVWSPAGLYLHFLVVAFAAFATSLGLFYRWSLLLFWLGFTYLQLLDVTLYLNHYYLVVLLSGLMMFMPLGRVLSLDALRSSRPPRNRVPAWCYLILRIQLSIVYFYAALAKAQPDWLLYGEPMSTWIRAHTELPLIGPWLEVSGMGLALSWCGFLYDLTIWVLLWWRRTRPVAFLLVLLFHLSTWLFFEIGMFPLIMIVGSSVFFDPSWPRRVWAGTTDREPTKRPEALPWLPTLVLGGYILTQALLPLRFLRHEGPVIWHEQGMRFAWRVMVREKNGSVSYQVYSKRRDRPWTVSAMDYLTWRQFSDMSGQPDLILQLGRHVAADLERKGFGPIRAVTADVWVSLNGRPPSRIVDPTIDLRTIKDKKDLDRWILPAPDTLPPRVVSASP